MLIKNKSGWTSKLLVRFSNVNAVPSGPDHQLVINLEIIMCGNFVIPTGYKNTVSHKLPTSVVKICTKT